MTSYGKNIKISVYGGSHDEEIGVVAENIPAGIRFSYSELCDFMKRRAPGQSKLTTSRKEPDTPLLVSGIDVDGDLCRTNGDVVKIAIKSTNVRSSDYANLAFTPRPSHADYPAYVKSKGQADLRGGGHFSGRLTAPICAIGGIFKQRLEENGIFIGAHIKSVKDAADESFNPVHIYKEDFEKILANPLPVINASAGEKMAEVIDSARMAQDSVGGVIECAAVGLPVGLGEHMFSGMEGRISSIVLSVPAMKGIEFGAGFASAEMFGSENNDPFYFDGGVVRTMTNNCGGILGGMTNGMPLIFRCAVKPTPSISREQDSVNLTTGENVKIQIKGRHDPCIVTRAVPVIEAACAIALFDACLDNGEMEI